MDEEIAASIPLPASTAATPFSSPLSRPQRWFCAPLSASPAATPPTERLSIIEIVPPTPPRRPRREIPLTPVEDEPESLPNSPITRSNAGTPGPERRTHKMINRMSGAFHAGTPPPAMRMLHPDDAKPRHAISNTYVKDGRRSSIVSNVPHSRRHSVVSVHGPRDLDARQEGEDGEGEEDYNHRSHSSRPIVEHRETTSDETYVSQTTTTDNWRTSTFTNITLAKAMRVDPLIALERRRRRDYTLGSHHPLHGPPNTPTGVGSRRASMMSDAAEEEVMNVEWADIVERFRTLWRRFGDMPWVADPCVATLVITQSTETGTKSTEPVVPWYRPKPTLDEMLEEGQGEGDNDSATLAHFGSAAAPHTKQTKWFPHKPPATHQTGRERFGDALVVRGIVRH